MLKIQKLVPHTYMSAVQQIMAALIFIVAAAVLHNG